MSEDARRNGGRRAHIVVVDDDGVDLELLNAEVTDRYGRAFDVVAWRSAGETLIALEAMQQSGQRVAVVLARQWMAEMDGPDLLARLRVLHPRAKRERLR
jgi:DNA-binding NtrC family response regulator